VRLTVELEGEHAPRDIPGGGADLVAFMSFAVARGFGAQHPYLALADLAHERGVPMGPLTHFYELTPDDAEDIEKLELAWQAAAPLAEAARRFGELLLLAPEADVFVRRAGATNLIEQVTALMHIAEEAAARPARVRLGFTR